MPQKNNLTNPFYYKLEQNNVIQIYVYSDEKQDWLEMTINDYRIYENNYYFNYSHGFGGFDGYIQGNNILKENQNLNIIKMKMKKLRFNIRRIPKYNKPVYLFTHEDNRMYIFKNNDFNNDVPIEISKKYYRYNESIRNYEFLYSNGFERINWVQGINCLELNC